MTSALWSRIRALERKIEVLFRIVLRQQAQILALQQQLNDARGGS